MFEEIKMQRFLKILDSLHPFLLSSLASVLTVTQIVLAFFIPGGSSSTWQWIGWVCLWIAGIFGTLPVFTFRRRGGVPKGESYMKTTVLVESGIYAVVRHPQGGTAWLLINFGVMLIAWHWLTLIFGVVSMVLVYVDTFQADQHCIEKFGDAYRQYMERVPRINFLAGIFRIMWLQVKGSRNV
jgi:protein-S-isoprenylcysteine O-methyltransferase Ste14